ncbi:class I SAM-dependent methyltransferase [Nitrolancea hollandica]|uniref:Methyltransferase type 12 n=1 Tax=Nitrolancea hollandica Lb TaxID=1129897 RepID=I4EI78_9BACT|nr:class I SAM-dependent methyltransferase [Nitrolancea hollandica]CCF84390.1 Methyltransferase type 12 [Nitrolancea hollandica Lb]
MAKSVAADLTEGESRRRDALVGRLFEAMLGTQDLLTIYLGDRLGLYRALEEQGPATSGELAARTGTHERYMREWLEQQAVTGILTVDDAGREATARRYSLPAGHAEVLLDLDSLNYLAYIGRFPVALAQAIPGILKAFRTGGGVLWEDFGPDAREGQAEQNRPIFRHLLGTTWLPALPALHARLRAHPPARVADIACGAGWSSIAIAEAYPEVRVDGFDLDEASIALARSNAAEVGLGERVTFHVRDAADPTLTGCYDLIIICEALHDLPQPVEVLRGMRARLAEGGTVLVVDERIAEQFTAPGDELERLYYGFSVLCCLPAGMAESPSAATGTVMRPATLRRYARDAGFQDIEILPIEHDLFRIYRLVV